jgi:hypothetical protein
MLKQSEQENTNGEEQRENRLRPTARHTPLPIAPIEQETVCERASPKTQGITERAKQKSKPQSQSQPMRYSDRSNASDKISLWQELITENPMYQKEILSGRRSLELQTPLKRFWKRALPLLILAGVYLSIYVFIIGVYSSAYQAFMDKNSNKYYIPEGFSDPASYAASRAQSTGIAIYFLVLLLQFFVTVIGIPATAITKITAERERMNWDALLLSRLTPLQVLTGKLVPVLKILGRTWLALLPAVAITAYTGRSLSNNYDNGLNGWGVVTGQLCLLITALMNIGIALYYSLTEKQSAKAALKAGQWFAIPTLGMGAVTGILYTLVYMVRMGAGNPNIPDWIHPFLWLPNIINPIFVTVLAVFPGSMFKEVLVGNMNTPGEAFSMWCFYLAWLFLPLLYPVGCGLVIRSLWKKMMRKFQDAPKDASG